MQSARRTVCLSVCPLVAEYLSAPLLQHQITSSHGWLIYRGISSSSSPSFESLKLAIRWQKDALSLSLSLPTENHPRAYVRTYVRKPFLCVLLPLGSESYLRGARKWHESVCLHTHTRAHQAAGGSSKPARY